MGLFGKKKEKTEKKEAPLKFPDIPSDIPKYEGISPEQKEIKEAIMPPLDIPQRKPPITRSKDLGMPNLPPIGPPKIGPDVEETHEIFNHAKKEKTMFVKVEEYHKAIKAIEKIKAKIEESQKVLDKLKELKDEEDMELETWQHNLEELKEKLLEVDSKLFEE